jgi:hypothetical protein
MSKVISISNHKGGVGKTTSAITVIGWFSCPSYVLLFALASLIYCHAFTQTVLLRFLLLASQFPSTFYNSLRLWLGETQQIQVMREYKYP